MTAGTSTASVGVALLAGVVAHAASSAAQVDEFHQAGVRAGFVCNGQPGLRPHYAPNYYAAFLRDPDGNNIEALAYLDPPGMASA